MESQAYLAGVLRDEAQSAAPYQEALDQANAAAGRTVVAQRDLVTGLHERQPLSGTAISHLEYSG